MIHVITLLLAFSMPDNGISGFISPRSFWYQHGHESNVMLMDRHRIEDEAGYLYMEKTSKMYFVIVVPVKVRLDGKHPGKVVEEYPLAPFEEALDYFPMLIQERYGLTTNPF